MGKKSEHIIGQAGNEYPFNAPEGYFDLLPMRIMESIETEKPMDQKSVFLRYLKPSFGLVAGFLLIFGLIYVPFRIFSPGISPRNQISAVDEVYFLTYALNDQNIFETLEYDSPDMPISNEQLENMLIGSVSEYELIVLNN
jgi:hypothetical protein